MNTKVTKLQAIMLAALVFALAGCSDNTKNAATSMNGINDTDTADAAVGASLEEKMQEYADNENPVAVIEMDDGGMIVMELYKEIAPVTVQNFLSLANSGFYDGLTFHRIDPAFMIQGGDPNGNGTGGPGYEIEGEFEINGHENNLSHTRGVVSMARRSDGYNTAGSQFFIVVQDSTFLDGQYAAFGKVLEGMDVVDAIAGADRNGEKPLSPRVMKTVRVAEGGTVAESNR